MTDILDHTAIEQGRKDPAAFIERFLINPETGKPFKLLPAEKQFLAHAFKTNKRGKLLYPEQVYGAPKKSGKTGFAAIYAITFVLLYGGRLPECICCANDFDQSVGRVFQAIKNIVESSPALRAAGRVTADKITLADATIIAIPSNYASAAGSNQNLAIFDELWAFTSENSRLLFDELTPPPTRKIAARLTVTHAGFEDSSELLLELYKRGLQQPRVGPDLYAGEGLLCFWTHDPVAPWQDEAWLADMRRSWRPNQYLRMAENRFVTTETGFVEMEWFDACVDPNATPLLTDRSLPIWAGIDASTTRDSTAVVAVTSDANKVRLVTHKVFQPSKAEPLNFEGTIENTVLDLVRRFNVRGVYYDPCQMVSTAQRLSAAGVPMVEYVQSVPNLTAIGSNLYELVKGRNIIVYPDAGIRLAISRAVAKETQRGFQITKEKSSHKIDVVVALAMAAHAAVLDQANRPVIVSQSLLQRAMQMPPRRAHPHSLRRTFIAPPIERQCYPMSALTHLVLRENGGTG